MILNLLKVIIPLAMLVGCSSENDSQTASSQKVQAELLVDINASDVRRILLSQNFPLENTQVYGYKAYKIPYTTKDEELRDVNVSGLLVLPTQLTQEIKENGLAMVSYSHGTISTNIEAPTEHARATRNINIPATAFTSLGGFATLQADYIGYGDSFEHYHPYLLKDSLVNATIDFIKTVKKFAQENDILLDEKIFLSGFSEGGYATMSSLKKIQEDTNISIVATAPIAGPYNLVSNIDFILNLPDDSLKDFSSAYKILLLDAYTKAYDENISLIIDDLYLSSISQLLDGKHSFLDIQNALPSQMIGDNALIINEFTQDYLSNSSNWLKLALKENSVDNWTPNTPLRLIHCQGDDTVPYKISQDTYTNMLLNGVTDIELITPDSQSRLNHVECLIPSLDYAVRWFIEKRDE